MRSVNFVNFQLLRSYLNPVDLALPPREDRRTMTDSFDRLEETIRARREADPESSYVAKLRAKGRPKMAQKLGEEAVETVIAALSGDKAALTGEAADLVFHLVALLADCGVTLDDVRAELDRREGVSGLEEKAGRTKD